MNSNFNLLRNTLLGSVLEGKATTTHAQRQAAFSNSGLSEPLKTLIEKVVNDSHAIENADIQAAKRSGLSEDQIFELVVCAAVGEATRQYEATLRLCD